MALAALCARGTLRFLVSQNCDGLHLRAGTPRRALAELHGNMFVERCAAAACRRVYLRAFDTTARTARHHHATGRLCHACGADLHDSIVHFGERGAAAWPLNWAGALRHAARADVVLCLGSSLKVLRRYPRLWRMQLPPRERPRLYIVNLQWTPKDSAAALKINARCDDVMRAVARRLRLRVPRYRPARDPLLAHAEPLAPPERHTAPPPLAPAAERDSASASDSDEELPLRRLADRLRRADRLCAFRVSMQCGEASILLRPEHAPPAPAPSPLRRVRIPGRDALNGLAPDGRINGGETNGRARPLDALDARNGSLEGDSKLRRLLERAPALDGNPEPKFEPTFESKRELELEPKLEFKLEPKPEPQPSPADGGSEEEGAGSLAAAIIARAVLVCRGSLYPGLHTILAPAPAPAPECAWCARQLRTRRCQWYGPPRLTPLAARPRRARRLCACCARPPSPPAPRPPRPPSPPRAPPDAPGGWYGKGYRKGRRRRR